MNLASNLFDYERPETRGEVIFFKLFELFVAYATVELAWYWGRYVQRISDVVLPLGIAQYLDVSFMFGSPLPLLNAGAITLLVVAGYFRLFRWAYLLAFMLLHLQYAARFVLGEIPHSANLVGMTLLGLSLGMLFFPDALHRRRFTLGFTYFYVGLAYTLAGFSKLVGTGLFWSDGRHLWLWIHEKAVDAFAKTGVLSYNWLQQLALDHHLVATTLLTVGLLTELGAFLMWWRRLRLPVILAVIGMHLGIFFSMNIMFKFSMVELILLGLPWAVWIDRVLKVQRARAITLPLEKLSLRYA